MPQAYRHMLGYFQLVNDVPGYEEMEFRRPGLTGDAGREQSREDGQHRGDGWNGDEEGAEAGEDVDAAPMGVEGGHAERRSGWVEDAGEDEEEMEKIDT